MRNKSKKKIETTFIKLLKRKRLNKITVKEICEKSHLNRGTFYNHYLDVFDLIKQIENDLINNLEKKLSKYTSNELNQDPFPLFKDLLNFIYDHFNIVSILLEKYDESLFQKKIIDLFKTRALNNWKKPYNNNIHYDYFLEYAIYGCLGIIKRWLQNDCLEDPNTLALLLNNMVTKGVNFLND
ncbi:MAG: TetR/AcrR family transcriptional regulator [Bacilli bacterium]|jgi:AcrR family transcriptional regulator